MNLEEFSAQFDILLNSYSIASDFGQTNSIYNITLNEYEKSVFLTQSEQEIFIGLYNGTSIPGVAFEMTEENRRYLDELVRTKVYTAQDAITKNDTLSNNSKIFKLEDNLAFITLEQVTYASSDKCIDGFKSKVYPVTQDEYDRVKDNPFRGPTKYKVLRVDRGEKLVELIPADGYNIGSYLVKYLKRPNPIILIDLHSTGLSIDGKIEATECEMNPLLHDTILKRAVALAIQAKSIGINNKNNKSD